MKEQIEIIARRQGVTMTELARRLDKTPANFLQQLKRDDFRRSDYEKIAQSLGVKFICKLEE